MGKAIVILSIVLGLVIISGFIIFPENIFRKETNKPLEEKEATNFLIDSTSTVVTTKKESADQDREEVLKKDEMANPPGQGVYKSVDEKGTINFSDNPSSSVIRAKKGAVKQDGAEVLKRTEMANPRPMTDDEIKAALLTMPTWRDGPSSSGGGGTVRRVKS